jgi:hypothetical protein
MRRVRAIVVGLVLAAVAVPAASPPARADASCPDWDDAFYPPCDDGRSDTFADQCVHGVCRGCPAPSPCRGYLYPNYYASDCGTFIDSGATCDDGNACTTDDTCGAAGCGGTAVDCDDGNPCTQDVCDPATGCAHETIPGCWGLSGRTVVTAYAEGEVAGRDVTCGPLRCQDPSGGTLLIDGRRYVQPSSQPVCPRTPTRIPDEVGDLVPVGRHRWRLRTRNRREIVRAIRRCTGRRFVLRVSQWIELGADDLRGVQRARTTVFAVVPIQETIVSRFAGRRGGVPPPAPLKPGLRSCTPAPEITCVAR